MIEFVIKTGIIIIAFHLFSLFITSWISIFDIDDEEYEYCYNCKHGMCMELPKSDKCQKWREENENIDK